MQIATISSQGLRWIAALVLVLWGCVVAENRIVRHARLDTVTVLAHLQRMRDSQHPIPVNQPINRPAAHTKPVIG